MTYSNKSSNLKKKKNNVPDNRATVTMTVRGRIESLIWDMNIHRRLYIYLKLINKKGHDLFLVAVAYMYRAPNHTTCSVFKYIHKHIIEVCLLPREKTMEMSCSGCWKLNQGGNPYLDKPINISGTFKCVSGNNH